MKASGSYVSLVHGVSQQVPQNRRPGQGTEQINMLPDPVQGLTRRHGSRWTAEKDLGFAASNMAVATTDTANWRTIEYSNAGNEYVVMIRTGAKPSGSPLPPLIAYNRTTGQFLTYTRNEEDTTLDALELGGISAATAVGSYLFLAGNNLIPIATSSNLWSASSNQQKAVVWVRGGAYSRTYSVTATKTDDTVVTFSYTTPTSSYQGTLDTSNVPVYAADPAGGTSSDTESAYITEDPPGSGQYRYQPAYAAWAPTSMVVKRGATTMTNVYPAAPANNNEYSYNVTTDSHVYFHSSNLLALDVTLTYTHVKTITNPIYTKLVGDITNEYNTAVTQWIGTAAEAIQPVNIAESLRLAAVAAGLTTATRQASHVIFDNVKALSVSDGGDGSLIRGVANEVSSVDQVSDIHAVGKVVKVRARNSQESFYLTATAKDNTAAGNYTEVIWVEGCGTRHTINFAFVYATVSGNNIYVASDADRLNDILPGTHPTYAVSTVGDNDTSPLPFFIGRKITYLGMFQDRLMVGAGAVVRASKIGDYLNFFRSSVLTVPADDPLEMLSQGSEDDELRHSVLYDRDLVIFGAKRQYAISGRIALTPTSANMATMSSHADAASMPPLSVGGVIFYAKLGESSSSVHQIEPGLNPESPETYLVSSQLDTYLSGAACEIASHAKPAVLFMRTKAARNSLFVFHYLDSKEGRKQDAWHRWDFATELGPIIGMSSTPNGLLVYTLRSANNTLWVVADLCPLTASLSQYPYLDSLRTWATVAADTGSLRPATPVGPWRVAFDHTSQWKLLGGDLDEATGLLAEYPSATGLWAGALMTTAYTPTNPFIRDRNDTVVTTGRLVVTSFVVSTAKSSGFSSTVVSQTGTDAREYNGRIMGDPNNVIGRVPITDTQQSVMIGRETREYTLTLSARTWLPFTITSLEWVGQWFNNTRRL